MARYKISNGDTYTIPDDDLEAIEVMNTTYPDAEVIDINTDTEKEKKEENGNGAISQRKQNRLDRVKKRDEEIKKQKEEDDNTPKGLIKRINKINEEVKSWAGEDMTIDLLDSPKRILKVSELNKKRNDLNNQLRETLKNESTLDALSKAYKKGDLALGEMLLSIPSYIYEVGSLISDPINRLFGREETDLTKFEESIGTRPLLDSLINEQEIISQQQEIYKDIFEIEGGIGENFSKGNYNTGFFLLGETLAESAPVSISLMAGGASGLSRAALTLGGGVPLAAGDMRTQQEEFPDQSKEIMLLKSTLVGISEGFFEGIFGSGALGKAYKNIVAKEGVNQGAKTFRQGIVSMYEGALSKYGGLAAIPGNGIEEAATQITQNMINGRPLNEGVTDAFLSGMGGGGLYSSPINLKKGIDLGKITLEKVKIKGLLKNTEFNSISDSFNPDVLTTDTQVELSQLKGSAQILDNQLKSKVAKGEINSEQSDAIKLNFAQTQGVTNRLKSLKLNKEDLSTTVQLLKEKKSLEDIIKQTEESNLTVEQSDRIDQINKDLKNIGTKAVTQQVDKIKEATKDVKNVDVQEFATSELTQAYISEQNPDADAVKGSQQQAFVVQRKDGSQTIVINREIADQEFAVAAPAHEALHALLYKTLKDNPKTAVNLAESLKKYLNNIDTNQIKDSNFQQRINQYKESGDKFQSEELLTLFSDAILTGDIKFNETILTQLGDVLRKVMQAAGVKIKFNEGRDVYNFIKDYNKNIQKGKLSRAQLQAFKGGIKGSLVETDVKNKIKPKTQYKFSQAESSRIDDLVGPKTDGKYTMTKAQWDAGGLNAAYNDLILGTGLDALIGKGIFGSEVQGVSRDQFKQNVKDRLTDELLRFNPEVNNSLSGFINSRLGFRKGDELKKLKKTKAASLDDETSSGKSFVSNIADTTAAPETATAKTPVSKLRRIVGTDIASGQEVARTILKGKLPATTDRKIKSAINKRAREEYLDDVKALIDDTFLEEKAVDIINTLSIQDVVKLERGSKDKILAKIVAKNLGPIAVDKAIAEGKLAKETNRTSGPNLYERLPIDKTKLIEFLKPRKIAFAGVIAENLAKDAIPGVMSEPDTQQRRRNVEEAQGRKTDETDKVKVSSAIDRDPTIKFSRAEIVKTNEHIFQKSFNISDSDFSNHAIDWKDILKIMGVPNLNLNNKTEREKFLNDLITSGFAAKLPKVFWKSFNGVSKPKIFDGKYYKTLDGNLILKETYNNLKENKPKIERDYDRQVFFLNTKDADNWIKKAENEGVKFPKESQEFKDLFTPFSYSKKVNKKTVSNIDKQKFNDPKFIRIQDNKMKALKKIALVFEKFMAEGKGKENAALVAGLLKSTAAWQGHFIRVASPVKFYSLGELFDKDGKRLFREEHTLPASGVAKYIFSIAAEKKVNEKFNNIEKNYFQGALLIKDDNKLKGQTLNGKKYNYIQTPPEGWNIETDNIWARYFNANVANNNFGIDPNSLMTYQGKTIFEVYGVNNSGNFIDDQYNKVKKQTAGYNNKILPVTVKFSKADSFINNTLNEMAELDKQETEAQIKFSKSIDLNKDFNDIIEKKTGIGTDKRYAKVKAQVAGASKGKFKFFIPPSAEDFVGLLYATLNKGKLGDAQMAWYKQNLLDPYAKAMNSISSDRISLMNDLKELKKLLKVIPKDLRSKVPGEAFTKEQAVRVYIWNSQGMSVPGLSKNDLKDLTDFVEQNENLKTFAEEVIQINKGEEYAPPDLGWVAGKIDTDLLKGLNTTRRSQYLKPWQDNVDVIFSEENLNKLEAAYGENYRIALEGILKRMKSGRNRPFADNSITGRVTDWLSNSVGAIMFFNTRSAVLQLLSTVNFVNFTDNNILKAGQAFANQPQYWKDVLNLMNSDFLKERRGGLRINVNEADIADMAKKSGARGVISRILQLGFAPTQIADSLAISLGGATFYRNRIKTLKKQGLTDKEAEDQAFIDFREVAEEAQQSSRPDRISEQQAGPLGRIILAFANTPAQYARIIKKAALDLKNGRGDAKTNLSKIIYYTFAQNFIFNALQQALFALSFGDDDDEKVDEKTKQKYFNIINSMSDSILRGIGIGGAVFSVIKNAIIKLSQQAEKPNPKYSKTLLNEALKISPPLSSKASKLTGIGWSLEKQQKEIKEKGFSLENPAYLAVGRAISFTTNIPADRALIKINNLAQSTRDDITTLERLALIGGWQDWELGIKKQDNTKVKSSSKRRVVKKKKSNKKRKF